MTNILKDINDVHWWFNCFVTIMLIALGYIVTEYLIKPIGLSTKQRSKGDFLISKSDKVDYAADVLFIKENEREEMRMRFDLTYIQRGISVRLMMLIVIIPAIGAYFVIEMWPMKIALVGFGLWSMFSTLRQLTKLIRVQKHLINILDEVRKG